MNKFDGAITYKHVQKVAIGTTYHSNDTVIDNVEDACTYLLCYGYITDWQNTVLVQVNKDYVGFKIKSIDLQIGHAWITKPTINISNQTITFTQQYEDGTAMQVIRMS